MHSFKKGFKLIRLFFHINITVKFYILVDIKIIEMKVNNKYTILFVLCFLFSFSLIEAGTSNYRFKKIGIEDGLSQTSILAIEQDKRGYMWFGTATGLNRYDGYDFIVYLNELNNPNSISNNKITAIHEDKNGVLWIGTSEGILNKFDPKTEKFQHFDIAKSSDWYSSEDEKFYNYPLTFSRHQMSTITTIAADNEGNLWLGTWGKGLVKFNPDTEKKKYYYYFKNKISYLSSNKVVDLLVDSDNILWIGTFGGGINKIDLNEDNIEQLPIGNVSNYNIFFGENIISIYEDSHRNLWIGSYSEGLTILSHNEKKTILNNNDQRNYGAVRKFPVKKIMDIKEDKDENIWIATFGNGLYSIEMGNWKLKNFVKEQNNPNAIGVNELQSLFVDNSGVLWIGTQLGSGINKLERGKNKFNMLSIQTEPNKSLNDNIVWAVCEDNEEKIWIGTHRGGINVWDKAQDKFSYYSEQNGFLDNHIRTIKKDEYGNLWIGTYNKGLVFYSNENKKFKNFVHTENDPRSLSYDQVQALQVDGDSILWIGTFGGGLNKLDLRDFYSTGKAEFKNYTYHPTSNITLSDNRVYSLYKDEEGNIWIGTHGGGVNKFDRESKTFTRFKYDEQNNKSLSNNRILVILGTENEDLLIGTFGGGLNRYIKEENTFERLNEKLGMNCSDIYGIIPDNFGFWLSTGNGIYFVDKEFTSFRNFDISDGLQSLEFSGGAYFMDSDSTYYFGGVNGLNYFTPSNITLDSYSPKVVISRIRVFDKPIKGDQENLVFDMDENYFSFEFASLDFKNPSKNKYKYLLEGLDSKWSFTDADNRKVFYTNLSPGEYTFKVNGTNEDGIWSPNEAQVSITILAPFWLRWWFISLLILVIGSIVIFFINQRIRYLVALDKLKTNIAADLHDNVGAGLTEISILSELASNYIGNPQNAVKHIKQISELSRQLVESMSDIVWVVNPTRDTLYDLIVRLKDMYGELFADMNVILNTPDLYTLESIKLPMDYRQNIYLMLKESINNCIKHSKCKKIDLIVTRDKNDIKIKLVDNGIGFDVENRKFGNGLNNIVERGKNIGGSVKIKSEIGIGTTIEFSGKIIK